ncbi:MAG TPA: universal stress protein [Chthoniobacteraceae bacterium]|nr:universal stress protein [Chthoniobacteraceae bacterium]
MNVASILVPVDFSDVTDAVVDAAMSMAAAFHSRLTLIHVEEPEPDFVGFEPGPVPVASAVPLMKRARQDQLEKLRARVVATNPQVSAVYTSGPIVERVREEAKSVGADLIVMGTHGHGALYNLLVGSVASGVMKHPPCPVLLVPSRSEKGA